MSVSSYSLSLFNHTTPAADCGLILIIDSIVQIQSRRLHARISFEGRFGESGGVAA